jgi:hypothetical protein
MADRGEASPGGGRCGMRGIERREAVGRKFLAAAALAVLSLPGCSPGYKTVGEAIFPYVDSVQAANWELLRCLYVGKSFPGAAGDASLAAFETWARGRVAAFEAARGRGEVDLSDDGIALIKAFGLGGGTLLGITNIEAKGKDAIEVVTPATFRYDEIDAPSLPENSVFHVAVAPLGKLVEVRVKSGSGELGLDALKEVRLRWTLERCPPRDGCSLAWGVASVAVVEGSAKTTPIRWKF